VAANGFEQAVCGGKGLAHEVVPGPVVIGAGRYQDRTAGQPCRKLAHAPSGAIMPESGTCWNTRLGPLDKATRRTTPSTKKARRGGRGNQPDATASVHG
jgi:hypothetical protein